MRWSIIRVIWARELRDQLRDRRTMFMIVVLPLLIYPLGGIGLMQIAVGFLEKRSTVAIYGAEHLPPAPSGEGTRFPPLMTTSKVGTFFHPGNFQEPVEHVLMPVRVQEADAQAWERDDLRGDWRPNPDRFRAPLEDRSADVVVVIPPDFREKLEKEQQPTVFLLSRTDDPSRQALSRVQKILSRWRDQLRRAQLAQHGLSEKVDSPILVEDVTAPRDTTRGAAGEIFELLVRIFPFILVLWSLAGALYPAVDLCAGEKERGTMETLLISPAQREEIVWGKFLAIWVFSAVTAALNLISMGVTSVIFSQKIGFGTFDISSFAWCFVLLLPLSAFFSALALALGAYARSTKEGQYYLMPLFLVIMPLILLTLAPGVELNPFYSMVPVTGVALLLQRLMIAGTPDPSLWLYFVPVLVPMVIYGWLALRWAIIQFQREEVLFREAERIEIRLWLRRLLRDKETRPSAGQALFCFILVLGLSWFSLGLGSELLTTNIIRFLAFVAAPTLLMAVLFTTQPRQSLALRMPSPWAWPVAILLALALTPPLAELTLILLDFNPNLKTLIEQYRPFTEWLSTLHVDSAEPVIARWPGLIVFAWLPAICEELTFRGFILTGLQRRFRPRTAVLLSSFLFSLLQMNVFQFIPTFLLGVVLGYLTTRCGSILPAMLFHLLYNTILLGSAFILPGSADHLVLFGLTPVPRRILAVTCAAISVLMLYWLTRRRPHPEYMAFLSSDPGLEHRLPDAPPRDGTSATIRP